MWQQEHSSKQRRQSQSFYSAASALYFFADPLWICRPLTGHASVGLRGSLSPSSGSGGLLGKAAVGENAPGKQARPPVRSNHGQLPVLHQRGKSSVSV